MLQLVSQEFCDREIGRRPFADKDARRCATPPDSDLRDKLIEHRLRSRHSDDHHPIFASANGTPLGHRNLTRRGFEPARDLAGLPKHLTLHDLRHACASRLIRSGLDVVTVASFLGHEDPNITLRTYAHLWNRQKTDEAVRLALAR
jgi:integrase